MTASGLLRTRSGGDSDDGLGGDVSIDRDDLDNTDVEYAVDADSVDEYLSDAPESDELDDDDQVDVFATDGFDPSEAGHLLGQMGTIQETSDSES